MSWQLALMVMEPPASLLMDLQRNGREVGLDLSGGTWRLGCTLRSNTEHYSVLLFFATQSSQTRDFMPAARVTATSHHYCSTVGTTITVVVLSYVGTM